MAEPNAGSGDLSALPEADIEVREGGPRFSLVWFIPLVAAVVGVWLVVKAYTEQGPQIEITFHAASGLEAGKTQVRYKNVRVGLVEEISVSDDLSGVIVSARLDRDMEPYLTDKTRFWVVRARVTAGGVSGLGTLLSGAYIAIDPHDEGRRTSRFTGLEVAPVVTRGMPGRHFTLRSDSLGSVSIGSPVYYRDIRTGEVVSHTLQEDGQTLDMEIFVQAPYDRYVLRNSRFWNASGIDVALDANGLRVHTGSMASLLAGGIAFELPPDAPSSERAAPDAVFKLYPDREAAFEETYLVKREWLMYFDGSVRGLSVGAPVEFRGIRIGTVRSIELQYNAEKRELQIPVISELETERIKGVIKDGRYEASIATAEERDAVMRRWVEEGLRAQLKTGSLITGQRYIDLDFYPDAPMAELDLSREPLLFPTLPTSAERIVENVASLSGQLAALPLQDIGNKVYAALATLNRVLGQTEELVAELKGSVTPEVNKTLAQARVTLGSGEQALGSIAPEMARTLEQAQATLAVAEGMLSTRAPVRRGLEDALRELAKATRALRLLTEYLEQHPEALLRGKGEQ